VDLLMTDLSVSSDDSAAEAYLDLLQGKFKELTALDSKIEELMDADEIEDEAVKSEEYAVLCMRNIKRLERHCAANEKSPVSSHSAGIAQAKLPKRPLPFFAGDVPSWRAFWEQFDALIHSNASLNDIDKFCYLLESLSRDAQSCIRGLSTTADNYPTAVKILMERFGKNDLVIRELMRRLSDLDLTENSLRGLQQFHDDISASKRSLENFGVYSTSYESLLVPSLLNKCPHEMRMDLLKAAQRQGTKIENLDALLSCLSAEIGLREDAGESHKSLRSVPSANFRRGSLQRLATADALVTSQDHNGSKVYCSYCKGAHASENCIKFADVASRRQVLRSENRCFKCLRTGHMSRECSAGRKCRICNGHHHSSLCLRSMARTSQDAVSPKQPNSARRTQRSDQCLTTDTKEDHQLHDSDNTTAPLHPLKNRSDMSDTALAMHISGNPAVALPVAKAILLNPDTGREMLVRILLDTASNRSYIREDACLQLELKGSNSEELRVAAFGGVQSTLTTRQVGFRIRKVDSFETFALHGNVVRDICQPQRSIRIGEFEHLRGLDLADPYDPRDEDMPITVLIGSDQFYDLVGDSVVRGTHGPVAMSSKLGFLLCGPLRIKSPFQSGPRGSAQTLCCSVREAPDSIVVENAEVANLWKLDTIGISDDPGITTDDFSCHPRLDKDRYTVNLPWKYPRETIDLKDHFNLAFRRLQSTMRHFQCKPGLRVQCDQIIAEQEASGIVEKLPSDESCCSTVDRIVHYMPHSCVTKQDSESTKVRIVFDGSAKLGRNDFSINDFLQTATPDFPRVPQILTRFRWQPVALMADIEKAFLQIAVDHDDRDSLRFLWTKGELGDGLQVVQYRFCRVPFGLTCSPGILQTIIQHHLDACTAEFGAVCTRLKRDIYVDNLVTSCASVDDATQLYHQTKDIFTRAGLNMRQWQSNCREFVAGLPVADVSSTQRVLGMRWNPSNDAFDMEFRSMATSALEAPFNKRQLLGVISRMFDPLGFLSPAITSAKVLFQRLCVSKVDWDCAMPEDVRRQWQCWLDSLQRMSFRVPRRLWNQEGGQTQFELHGFADASEKAYAACVYLRAVDHHHRHVTVTLVMGKSRVAPVRSISISRLELLGAMILARLMNFVSTSLPDIPRTLWTDSMNALQWISQESRLRQRFIQNRVQEIRKLTSVAEWKHVAGLENPADLPSRGCLPEELTRESSWLLGPSFLRNYTSESQDNGDRVVTREMSDSPLVDESTLVCDSDVGSLSSLVDVSRFSSWVKLVRVFAWVRRFIHAVRSRSLDSSDTQERTLSAQELNDSWLVVIRDVQRIGLSNELSHLRGRARPTALVRDLNLFLDDDGLIRAKGRLAASVPFDENHPVLIPRGSEAEDLIIRHCHDVVLHGGVAATLCKIREQYWILRGRQKVKQTLAKCVTCRRMQGRPFTVAQTPDLPDFRRQALRAFQTVGIDYAGPMYYRTGEERSDKGAKAYIVLFSCAATRAIHLEVVTSLETDQMLHALRRFIARRGIPSIISDNAKTFRSAASMIGAHVTEDLREFCASRRISWNFIPEKAAWWGGFWERLVAMVKSAFKKTVKRSLLSLRELITTTIEVEAVVNSRPLLYVPAGDTCEVITPAHFVSLSRLTLEPSATNTFMPPVLPLPDRLRHVRSVLCHFWDQWKSVYLQSLRERAQSPQTQSPPPREGDVVLIEGDAKQPRIHWKLGRIEELKKGRDGICRSAIVRIASGSHAKRWDTVRRPVQALIPLEVSSVLSNS
jgi:hypothetical protein